MTEIVFTIGSHGGADLVLPAAPREHAILPCGCHPERSEGSPSRREYVVAREVLRSAQDDNAFFRTDARDERFLYITMPPSTVRTWPVMYFASGAARKATAAAMSSPWPNLPNGILDRIASLV